MLPFAVVDTGRAVFRLNRFNSERKAEPVGNLAKIFSGREVVIKFLSVDPVGVYDEVRMDVLFVNVCRDYYLAVITESLSCKSSAYLMSKFRRDFVLWVE